MPEKTVVFKELILLAFSALVVVFVGSLFSFYLDKFYLYIRNKFQVSSEAEGTHSDEPITKESEDKLGRADFVDLIESIATNTWKHQEADGSNSTVIGLYGEWGVGKSSVLNLLKGRFKEETSVVVFDFNPWAFTEKEHLVGDFFKELKKDILSKFYLPSLSIEISKYKSILNLSSSYYAKIILTILHIFSSEKTIEQQKSTIETILTKKNIKVLAIIDDIDRLDEKDLLKVFKLVKVTANFKNIVFVLPFDNVVVSKTLKKESGADSKYLEKIIQIPIHVPKPSINTLQAILSQELLKLFATYGVSEDYESDKQNIDFALRTYVSPAILNIRDIKRYVNAIFTRSPKIIREINLQDFLLIEAIRVVCPLIMDDMWLNHRYYLPYSSESMDYDFARDRKNATFANQAREHFEQLLKDHPRQDWIISILRKVFPDIDSMYREQFNGHRTSPSKSKKLSEPTVFIKYHILGFTEGTVSSSEVEDIIKKWNKDAETIESDLNRKIEDKSIASFLKTFYLFQEDLTDKAAAEVSKVLLNKVDIIESNEYEMPQIISLIQEVLNKEEIDQKLLEETLLGLIQSTKLDYIKVRLSLSATKHKGHYHIGKKIDPNTLKNVLIKHFREKIIVSKQTIFKDKYWWHVFEWIIEEMSEADVNKIKESFTHYIDSPNQIGRITLGFVLRWDKKDWDIKYDDMAKIFVPATVAGLIKKHRAEVTDEDEIRAMDLFMKVYSARSSK